MGWPDLKEAVAGVREVFGDNDHWPRDGISPVEVLERDEEILVVFRWQRDPQLYAFPVATGDIPESPWTGDRVDTAQEWAWDVVGLLEEELLTGYVARATRVLVEGRIELRHPDHRPGQPEGPGEPEALTEPNRFSVSEVQYDGMASWMAAVGLDIAEPLRLKAEGRLLGWEALCLNDSSAPVGSAATCWDTAPIARLARLETLPGVATTATLHLVRAAVRGAADSGATFVVTDLPVPHGEILGFRPAKDGSLRLDTHLLGTDHAALAALRKAEPRQPPIDTGTPVPSIVMVVSSHDDAADDEGSCTVVEDDDDPDAP